MSLYIRTLISVGGACLQPAWSPVLRRQEFRLGPVTERGNLRSLSGRRGGCICSSIDVGESLPSEGMQIIDLNDSTTSHEG